MDDPILPCAEGGTKYYSAWYRYTPTENKQLTLDTNGSNYDTVLAIWTGPRGSLVNQGCDDDSGDGTASLISLNVTSGVTYSIELVSFYADVPGTSLTLNIISSANPPGAFGKVSPANGATGQSTSPNLQWGASSTAVSYEYCYDTTNDAACTSWTSVGANNSVSLSGLSTATTYYWQVRANNTGGTTYADGSASAFWSFTTVPGANNDDLDTPLVISVTPYFSTQSVNGYSTAADDPDLPCASGKKYLSAWYQFTPAQAGQLLVNTNGSNYDTILAVWTGTRGSLVNIGCNDDPGSNSSSLSLSLTGGVVYSIEITSFSSIPRDPTLAFSAGFTPVAPGAFSKSAPANAATYVAMNPVLTWDSSSGAASYEYCIDTTNNAACDTSWVSVGAALKVNLSGLSEQTFHYWQVRAVNPGGTTSANGGSWWSFKTRLFNDVDGNYWARDWIERLYNAGVTTGCNTNPLVYCPEGLVTRAEMAVFLERGMKGAGFVPPPASGIFVDVPISHWAAAWIEQLYADGVTTGCLPSAPSYCPEGLVTRAEMAIFLLRAEHGSGYAPPPATGVFSDVPVSHWAAAWIEQLFAEGITTGCDVGKYCPEQSVTRAQMAAFLVRTFNLP